MENLNHSMLLGLMTGSIIIFLAGMILLVCYYILAPKNIFFTFGKENCVMYVMTGKKFTGKTILSTKTSYIDNDYNIKEGRSKLNTFNFLGMYWIGIYPFYSIYERRQQWLEWKSDSNGKRQIVVRDEMTPYLIAKPFEYTMLLEEGEDKNGMPLNVYFTVILKPLHATLPIFGNDNTYGQVQTLCRTEVLLFVKEKTFSNLGGENSSTNISTDEFSTVVCRLNILIPGRDDKLGIKEVLGYQIMDAKLDSIEVVGENKEKLLEATTMKYVAEEKAKAKVIEAEGNLQSTKLEAEGKKAMFDVQKEYLHDISSIPGAVKVEERKATPNLTTLVESDSDKKTNLLIGGK